MEGLDVVCGGGGAGAEEDEEVRGGLDDDEGAEERGPAEEVDEELVVVEADAVAHPRAVVVHLEAAPPARAAVVAALGLGPPALGAARHRLPRPRKAPCLLLVLLISTGLRCGLVVVRCASGQLSTETTRR